MEVGKMGKGSVICFPNKEAAVLGGRGSPVPLPSELLVFPAGGGSWARGNEKSLTD